MSSLDFDDPDGGGHNGADSQVATASGRSNVISNKLTSALSTSYTDSEIRDALGLLDARGTKNNAEARRNLRLDAQQEVIECNAQVVDDFGKVAEQLQRVGAILATLNATCDEMRKHISLAKQESAPMLEEATSLMANKQESETKQEILNAFNAHFIISDADLTTLTSSAEPVNERFFTILGRVKQIDKDCEALLGAENQRLGLELMEQTTRNLDAGFKKLYNWIQREFKVLDLEDPHISGSIRRALRVLSERPTLFQNCLDFFAEAREQTLSDAFQLALTESTGPSAKAIEFSTHDLQRYVGDMLAWVHSTTVSEKEALEGLFIADADEIAKSMKVGRSAEPWSRIATTEEDEDQDADAEPTFDGRKALNDLVGRNLAGVCQTLQSRIETAVRTTDDPALVYKVLNLLTFYQTMFSKQVGANTHLTNVLANLEAFSATHFEAVVQDEQSNLSLDATSAPADLTPPSFLTTALHQLVDLASAKGPQMSAAEFETLFSTLVSTPLSTCGSLSTAIPDPRRRATFTLNYLSAIRSALSATASQPGLEDAASPSLSRATTQIAAQKTSLTESLQSSFLTDSGVGALLDALSTASASDDLAAQLEDSARTLDAFLPSALMDAADSLGGVVERALAREVVGAAVDGFCDAFEELEGLLLVAEEEAEKEKGKDGVVNGEGEDAEQEGEERVSLRELYPRTSAEVRALLS